MVINDLDIGYLQIQSIPFHKSYLEVNNTHIFCFKTFFIALLVEIIIVVAV